MVHDPRTAMAVDPYSGYSSQPAPMGIADYGIGASGVTYSYSTDEFVGTANISALKFQNNVGDLQLNVVLFFGAAGVTYAYWIQDIVTFGTTNGWTTFWDNIWNLTAGGPGGVLNSTIRPGCNGTVDDTTKDGYYYDNAANQPGNNVDLKFPQTVLLRVRSNISTGGVPRVYFDFNDGYGWQTYDTVDFFPSGVTTAQFQVNGTAYLDSYLFDDAEFVFTGGGNGASTGFTAANVNLSLQFDNGHNLQGVPNAYNFGGDTAETSYDVSATREVQPGTGLFLTHLAYDPQYGNLNRLYTRNYSAIFNVTTTRINSGSYSVNGTVLGSFRNYAVNLTLAPGNYSVTLFNSSSTPETVDIALQPGEYLAYEFYPPPTYNLTFTNSGLPAGTGWSVQIAGRQQLSDNSSLTLALRNGSYGFELGLVSGWLPEPKRGLVSIAGNGRVVLVNWTRVTYALTVTAGGLPQGANWSLLINGAQVWARNGSVVTYLPNGSFAWGVRSVAGYRPATEGGTLFIDNQSLSFDLPFTPIVYGVIFSQVGLPANTLWGVLVAGANLTGSSNVLRVALPNGSYEFTIYTPAPYRASEAAGTLLVSGNATTHIVSFTPDAGILTGTVSPSGALVMVNGSLVPVRGGSYSLVLAPGSYTIEVTLTGYSPQEWTVTLGPGEHLSLNFTLSSIPTTRSPPSLGAPGSGAPISSPLVVALVLAVAAVAGVAAWNIRRHRRGP